MSAIQRSRPSSKKRKSEGGRAPRDLTTLLSGRKEDARNIGPASYQKLPSTGAPVTTGLVHLPRRGIFYASELLYSKDAKEYEKEFAELERVCVVRFPPEVASILRERLAVQLETLGVEDEDEELGRNAGELGLTISPTSKEDYRVFDVEVERELGQPSTAIILTGVLVELPSLLEAYKSLEGELLFKSADISQMLYVFDPTVGPPFDLAKIRDSQFWEWRSGLTPGTHRIRSRRFKNFRVFDKADVSITEREICDILGQRANKERAILEASTEDIYEHHLERILAGSLEPGVVGVIGPENPVIRAALDGSSPLTAVEMMGQSSLLRNVIGNELSFKEKLKFSSDPSMNIEEDQIIRDDLSERLFGEFGLEKDLNVEDDFQLEQDVASSESSLLSSDEDIRRQKKSKPLS